VEKVLIRRLFAFFSLILVAIVSITGCKVPGPVANAITVAGAWDLISPLQRQIIPSYNQRTQTPFQVEFSSSAVEKVRQGKADIAIVGKELAPQELTGLTSNVIAYDAVCMVIDANSFAGGQYIRNGVPVSKTAGFQDVSSSELKSILKNYMTPYGQRWFWENGYYVWKQVFDTSTGLYSSQSEWIPSEIAIYPSLNMTPGKYDTQTVVYQALGISEASMAKARNNQFTDSKLDAEEEVLSVEYYNGVPYSVGSGDFAFKIGFMSRRVIPIALQHVPIKVVSINGFDPMNDKGAIYDGRYPLGRKIYVITRQDCSSAVFDFVHFLLSEEGQTTIKDAGYLAVPGLEGFNDAR